MNLPKKRSWWGRNWLWVVPVGCLLPILSCVGIITMIVTLVFGMLKSSHPYQDSFATLQSDPRVISALGTPIEADFFVSGQINLQNSSGNANLSYGVTGPNGSATVYVVATKSAGKWTYSELIVTPDTNNQDIDLLTTP